METKNENSIINFHAVEYMRQVRTELSEKFLQDKKQYLDYLKASMEAFKIRQAQAGKR